MDLDNRIKAVIIELFPLHDKDNSGTLNPHELAGFFNQAFQKLGINIVLSPQEAIHALQRYDVNYDTQITKEEAFAALKQLAAPQTSPQGQPPQNAPWAPTANYPVPGGWGQQQPPAMNNNMQWGGMQNQRNAPNTQLGNPWNQPNPYAQVVPQTYGQGNHIPGGGMQMPIGNNVQMQAKKYVDEAFLKYDKDRSGFLDARELGDVFNDILRHLGIPIELNQMQAMAMLRQIDRSNDGRVQKPQLYLCVKNLMDMSPAHNY